MEEQETTKKNGQVRQDNKVRSEATSNVATSGAVEQMPSSGAEFTQCAGIRGRPAQTEKTFMTPKEIALILRQLGDNLEKEAEERATNSNEKGG